MSPPVRSKKMALFDSRRGQGVTAGQTQPKMVRIGPMASPKFPLDRRELMAGLGAAALVPVWPATGAAQAPPCAGAAGQSRQLSPSARASRRRRSGRCRVSRELRLQARRAPSRSPSATNCRYRRVLNWRGIDGVPGGRTADGAGPARGRRQGNPATAAAPCRDLSVRPAAARRWPGAAIAGTRADRPRKASRRRRSRRGIPDRGLAAPRRRNRDRARRRSAGYRAGLHG